MIDDAMIAQRRLSCLGGPSRYRLVRELLEGQRCVSELAAEIGLSQSCTTRHLQALERERLVVRARDGKRVMVRLRLEEPGVPALLDLALQGGAPMGTPAPAMPGGASLHRDGSAPAPGRASRPPRRRARSAATPSRASAPASGFEPPQPSTPPVAALAPAPPITPPAPRAPEPAVETVAPRSAPVRARPARGEIEDFLL